jgi:acyl-coenzyme A synthetase/AMP-(fatty) acid ligase
LTSVPSNFADLILLHARVRPEKPAIVLADRIVTYDMMAQGILRVQDRLRKLELTTGALVGIAIESPIRHMIVAAALFRLGHPSLSIRRIADVLPLALPVGAFLHAEGETLHVGQRQIFVGDDWFAGERRPITATRAAGFTDDRAICRVELSSGTTGRPKPISLSVGALYQWIINYYAAVGLGLWDRLLCMPGFTSSWGFSLAAHVMFAGKTMAFAPTPRDALQMIAVYSIDALAASTQQLRELVGEQVQAPIPCPTLRVVLTGGSPVARSLMLDAGARLCSSIVNLYGSTEAGATAFATIDRLIGIDGATGYVAPWAEVEIVDDDGNRLAPETEGMLRIRATCQGEPYPPGRADGHASFRNGWFYPGDRGRVTADGLLVVSGRTSEIINAGGIKLAPAVIEDAMQRHPAVVEAAAIGRTGADGVEEVVILIVPRHPVSEQSVVDWCAERGIPVAQVIVVDELPKTASGKLQRDLIKQQHGA